MHVVRLAVATAKNARLVRVVIVVAAAVQLTRKVRNAVAVLPILVKHKRKNRRI